MKKINKLSLTMLLSAGLILGACSATDTSDETSESAAADTVTYTTVDGEEIAVPANPERVVVLSSYAGDLINFDINIVGVDAWSAGNPNFSEGLSGVAVVSNADVEKILELEPDLIIGLDNIENADQLSEIAPTVLFTYGELSYLDQIVEIGKVVNKEEEAVAWVEEFQTEA
ncbi:MAG: ABC transporter substrate-binding protein, partial [Trichococcus flocculiformis]